MRNHPSVQKEVELEGLDVVEEENICHARFLVSQEGVIMQCRVHSLTGETKTDSNSSKSRGEMYGIDEGILSHEFQLKVKV